MPGRQARQAAACGSAVAVALDTAGSVAVLLVVKLLVLAIRFIEEAVLQERPCHVFRPVGGGL